MAAASARTVMLVWISNLKLADQVDYDSSLGSEPEFRKDFLDLA